jgi:hypothetical protein
MAEPVRRGCGAAEEPDEACDGGVRLNCAPILSRGAVFISNQQLDRQMSSSIIQPSSMLRKND